MKKLFLFLILAITAIQGSEAGVLTLKAQASIQKTADTIQMTLGVVTLGEHAESALFENSAKMKAIIDVLKVAGLEPNEYETGNFSITPVYTSHPFNPPPDWKQQINGYQVNNSLIIRTSKLGLAGTWIDLASKAGSNNIANISFTLRDSRTSWQQAITQATKNGIEDAEAMARTAGLRSIRIRSIHLDNTHMSSPSLDVQCFAPLSGGNPPPIEAGQVHVTATVSMTFDIE